MLLFYRADNGAISTARIEADGTFEGLKDGGVKPDWSLITGGRGGTSVTSH
jgi:hypothetical protein